MPRRNFRPQQRRRRPQIDPAADALTYDDLARDLVARGLASPQILAGGHKRAEGKR
jgi:hypothetical protein